jgi:formylglycine-generating enzyme required for sulfatase activity
VKSARSGRLPTLAKAISIVPFVLATSACSKHDSADAGADAADGGLASTSGFESADALPPLPEVARQNEETHVFAPRTPAKAGQVVQIPAGKLLCGSTPGDPGRDPTDEPVEVPIDVGAFGIDALPFPNDPGQPPRTGVTRQAAAAACSERGARLCTEVEWERACKGPNDASDAGFGADEYATGKTWNPDCDKEPATCASPSGARAMGATREWTAGDDQRGEAHRCAARTAVPPDRADSAATFRCCHGNATAAVIPEPTQEIPFRRPKLDAAEIGAIFAKVPELARVAPDVKFFDPGDANGIVNRSTGSHEGVTFTESPVLWSPEPGAELLVVVGHAKSSSFVVALYPLPEGKYRLASSFLMQNDLSPVALAFDGHRRKELIWTSCWSCAGDQGHVSLRDDHRVVIVQD